MKPCLAGWIAVFITLACPSLPAAEDPALSHLRAGHPRLILTGDRIAELKQITDSDPLAKRWKEILLRDAEKMLAAKRIEYGLEGKKLLDQSRAALDRVTTLAALYRITGEARFKERAIDEMRNVCSFPDWNPDNFLATAEMTNAVALGYDWLFDELSAEDRDHFKNALIEKGLKPGLNAYARGKGWPTVKHNWNAVCNDGLIIGALAIADEVPDLSNKVIGAARQSLQKGYLDFAPDGGWPEGPGYWGYCTSYAVFGCAAMRTALGQDFDFSNKPGFSETGNFRIQMLGTSGQIFGFADSTSEARTSPQMFWLASAFDRPAYDAFERRLADRKPDIFHLIWFNPKFSNPAATTALESQPLSRTFTGVNVALLRSSTEKGATFLGIKGGDNKTNHAHLDLGTFVLDAKGERWAIELGPDQYTLPGYFGSNRWDYYRTRTEGQNTLAIGGENQITTGRAGIVSFDGSVQKPAVAIDLTGGYAGADKIQRTASLDGSAAIIEDQIVLKQPAEIIWGFHTKAKVTIDHRTATLSQNGTSLKVELISPEAATFSVAPVELKPPQRASPGVSRLTVQLPGQTATARISVRFTPQ